MFSVEDRNRVYDHIIQLANTDARICAGAVVGSLALSAGDRWSDLDLTFAVKDEFPVSTVLADWTRAIVKTFNAAHLFDLPAGPSIYRVFLLPGCLQFDLSFTPASQFGATGPKFRLLFGNAVVRAYTQSPPARELFGYAIHHVLRARFCIERGRYWHAEYWISSARAYALSLACLRRGLPATYGRGFDDLPAEVLALYSNTLVASLEREPLLQALRSVIAGLLHETADVEELAKQVEPQLHELSNAWNNN